MTEYLCGTVSDGVVGKISVLQIWNPVDSGVEFVVDVLDLAWNTTAANYNVMLQANMKPDGTGVPVPVFQGFDLNWFDEPIGPGNVRKLRSCVSTMAAAACPIEMQTDAWATPYPTSVLFHEAWKQTIGDMKPFPFRRKPRIQPGMGLLVRSALNYCWSICNVQGSATPIS